MPPKWHCGPTTPTQCGSIACNEQVTSNAGLLRIRLSDGASEAIVKSGLSSCDPVHATPWGTIVFGEKRGLAGASSNSPTS